MGSASKFCYLDVLVTDIVNKIVNNFVIHVFVDDILEILLVVENIFVSIHFSLHFQTGVEVSSSFFVWWITAKVYATSTKPPIDDNWFRL